MKVNKRILAELPMVYAVQRIDLRGETHLLAASEDKRECLLFSPPDWNASAVWHRPGGTMNMTAYPGRPGELLAIQKFFPIFQSEQACVIHASQGAAVAEPWQVQELFPLPYVHRIETVQAGGVPFLIAATLCGSKRHQEDWSSAGALYAARFPEEAGGEWELRPILTGLTKNHGLLVDRTDGTEAVLVSAEEGLFRISVPSEPKGEWLAERMLDRPVSEAVLLDLDGDGELELAAVEPFHGDRLAVYKRRAGRWEPIFEGGVSFGHVILEVKAAGKTGLLVGNRSGSRALEIWLPDSYCGEGELRFGKFVVDEGVGPTQALVLEDKEGLKILSANHYRGEVALYEIELE